jgi:undecaprenyl diphosphate synthase
VAKVTLRLPKLLQKRSGRSVSGVDMEDVPRHLAIIMDGNGRWARRRGLPRSAGHYAGMQALRRTIRAAADVGIRYLTFYAFSTENWQRPQDEVEFLLRLPSEFLKTDLPELIAKNVRIRFLGSLVELPSHTRKAARDALAATAANTGMVVSFAVNYGSRSEIILAVREIARTCTSGILEPEAINEETLSDRLFTAGLPDPDLLIRPGGEQRLSNFLLWQSAYTEFWFPKVCWPDFDREHLLEAIEVYKRRDRRYGGIKL